MPLIRNLQILDDRVIISTPTGDRTFTYSRISQQIRNQGAAACEAVANEYLNDPVNDVAVSPDGHRYFYIEAIIITVEPLLFTFIVSDEPITQQQRDEARTLDP